MPTGDEAIDAAFSAPTVATAPNFSTTGDEAIDTAFGTATSAKQQPITYNADLFRKRVGRDPEPAELANFRANKGAGWAGDPGITRESNPVGIAADRLVGGAVREIVGGYSGLAKLVTRQGSDAATEAVERITNDRVTPSGGAAQATSNAIGSRWNPMNYVDEAGEWLADRSADAGAPPWLSTAIRIAPDAAASVFGLRRGGTKSAPAPEAPPPPSPSPQLSASGAPRAPSFEPVDIPGKPGVSIDTEPVEGGIGSVSKTSNPAVQERAAILSRVGIEDARRSALEGNAKDAATDFQLSRFDEPAGVAAKAQFDNERTALQQHSESLVQKAGGTLGTDEDSLNNRGQTIARPFDALNDWFDVRRKELYGAADQRANGAPVTNLDGVDALLKDPQFRNTLLAKDQGGLLNAMESQLAEFRKQSPQGFNVKGAEQVRRWLNQVWTNDNKAVIGQVKSALDNDVLKGAGEDIYGPARNLVQMKNQTLDNPSGINKLMEHDPQTPINRTTSFEKIPDTLLRLPVAQFDNVLKTLDTMPEEIQPLAQAAKAEIKAHLLNKVNDAGTSTQGQWNARGVEKVVKTNSAKLQSAFADQPEILHGVSDLRSAGKILSVNQSYPGAAAQAANALKRGLMSHAVGKLTATGGAAAGGAIAGPLGAAGGAAVGEAVGSRVSGNIASNAALKRWQSGLAKTTEVANP